MFEFGWIFWVMFFAIFFGCGRMCGWGARRYVDRRSIDETGKDAGKDAGKYYMSGSGRAEIGDGASDRHMSDAMNRGGWEEKRATSTVGLSRDTPLQKLQKKFVEGRLTMEEYERELDHLDRIE